MTANVDGDTLAGLIPATKSLYCDSFDAIYLKYKPILIRYATKFGASDPEGVADLALYDLYRAFDRIERREERSIRSYLFRAARSHVVTDRRQGSIDLTKEIEGGAALESPLVARALAERFESEFVEASWLCGLVQDLPPDQRAVIENRFFGDLTAAATAEKLNKDPNAVYQLQHRALQRLRRAIAAAAIVAALSVLLWVLARTDHPRTVVDNSPATRPETSMAAEHRRDGPEPAAGAGVAGEPLRDSPEVSNLGLTGTMPAAATPGATAGDTTTNTTHESPSTTSAPDTTPVTNPPVTTPVTGGTAATSAAPPPSTQAVLGPNLIGVGPTCNGLAATIVGTDKHDYIVGTEGSDIIYGGAGKDTIYGLGGNDMICGGTSKDELLGGDGDDTLIGGPVNEKDTLDGGAGNNILIQAGN